MSRIRALDGPEDGRREELVRTRTLGVCAERDGLFLAVGNGARSGHAELHCVCLEVKGAFLETSLCKALALKVSLGC